MNPSFLTQLYKRKAESNYRRLFSVPEGGIDFFSNDYLGISRDFESLGLTGFSFQGSTGSRLLSGNSQAAGECELFLANKFKSEAALVFNSGYDANLGLLSSVPQKNDTIIYDELIHASIRDGIRLSLARSFSFRHNDCDDLKKKIQQASGTVFIVIESVYSMNGDLAPIQAMAEICSDSTAYLIIDEAHASGIYGEDGGGLVSELRLENKIFARVITFSKAYGYFGAAVLGSTDLTDYLINFCRPLIYSTALPRDYYSCLTEILKLDLTERRRRLFSNLKFFNEAAILSPIQIISEPLDNLKRISGELKESAIFQKIIYSPTVPKGSECIRLCFHSFNTPEEITLLLKCWKRV